MTKRITDSQILGELGETAIKKLVLEMQFIYDPRGRLETPAVANPWSMQGGSPVRRSLSRLNSGKDFKSAPKRRSPTGMSS